MYESTLPWGQVSENIYSDWKSDYFLAYLALLDARRYEI